jgi:glycosyltransferase involved in cell wall biosynthesis
VRVLQLHNLHKASGGAAHVVDQEAELLRSAGHQVDQLLEPAAEDSGMGAAAMGVAAVWNRRACRQLAERIESFDPDVVHVHTPFPLLSPAVFRTAHSRGRATVTTLHGYRYSCVGGTCLRAGATCEDCVGSRLKLPGVRHRCYHGSLAASAALTVSLVGHRVAGTFAHDVDRYVALTGFGRDLLVRDGYPAHKVTVKPNMVPDPGPPVPQDARGGYALFAGRLVEEKGVRTLLEAWRRTPEGLHLHVAGDGPLRPLVEAAAEENPRVHALGWCDADRVADLQANASATIVPSEWYEAQPLVTLQSLAAGTPLLVSDLPNVCASVVEHGAGRAFRTADPAALASEATRLLTDEAARATMGGRARSLYEAEHTPAAALAALERIYTDALAQSARADRGRDPRPAGGR